MDNPTRRLDRSELPSEIDAETTRLDTPPGAIRCLRCGGEMIPTRLTSSVGLRSAAAPGVTDPVPCDSLSCGDCGYTELYATDPAKLKAAYNWRWRNNQKAEEVNRLFVEG